MEQKLSKGYLLIASGSLLDPNFQKTVILLCDHHKNGSYGLILNRQLSDIEVQESFPFVGKRLFQGGPVQMDVLQVVHPYGDRVKDSFEIIHGLWLGGDFDILQDGFLTGEFDPDRCRFFLGYSGWATGQLAAEFQTGSWLCYPASKTLVMNDDPESLWSQTIREYATTNPVYKYFPENPSWN